MSITASFLFAAIFKKIKDILTAIPFKYILLAVGVLILVASAWSYRNLVIDKTSLQAEVVKLQDQTNEMTKRIAEIEQAERDRAAALEEVVRTQEKSSAELNKAKKALSPSNVNSASAAGGNDAVSKLINDAMHKTIDCIETVSSGRECDQ